MTIRYTCQCGVRFRLPDTTIGRKARCPACNTVSIVTPDQPGRDKASIPLQGDEASAKQCQTPFDAEESTIGRWLEEFGKHESDASSQTNPTTLIPSRQSRQSHRNEPDDILAAPVRRPHRSATAEDASQPDEDRDWITGPEQPFWKDWAESFVFFTDANNFLTLFFLTLINMTNTLLPHGGILGLLGSVLVNGYLCAVAMAIVVETASGENELPNLWIDDILDDLVMPMFRCLGTWAFCLIPVGLVQLLAWYNGLELPHTAFIALAAACAFFWPVVVLCVAIGGGFQGLWPHTIIRTAWAAPLPYLAVWGALLVAAGVTFLPDTDLFASLGSRWGVRGMILLRMAGYAMSVYAMIVAMRVIGLFYRHYKKRFPWVAE